jgi:hypothetical protein
MLPQAAPAPAYITTHDAIIYAAIIYAMETYLEGIREGNSSICGQLSIGQLRSSDTTPAE